MSRRWKISVQLEDDVCTVRGWRGGEVLRAAGLRPLWSSSASGWVVDGYRAPDALAAVENSGAAVLVTGKPIEVIDPETVEPVYEQICFDFDPEPAA